MVLFNITVSVDNDLTAEFVHWVKREHIPEIMETGKFVSFKFFRVLNQQAGDGSTSYAIQLFTKDIGTLQSYLGANAPIIQQKMQDKYGEKAVPFHTVLQEA